MMVVNDDNFGDIFTFGKYIVFNSVKVAELPHSRIIDALSKSKGKQLPGTDAIRTKVRPSKPKMEITKATNSHKKENILVQLTE